MSGIDEARGRLLKLAVARLLAEGKAEAEARAPAERALEAPPCSPVLTIKERDDRSEAVGIRRAKSVRYAVASTTVSPIVTRGGRYAISPRLSRMTSTTRSCERSASSRLSNSVTDTARFGSASSRKA